MPKFEDSEYRSIQEYREAIDAFHGFCTLVLLAFAKHDCDIKDTIIRNLIARTDMMVRGVLRLWDIADFQDCWILYRCLTDRLFHLVHLGKTGEYQLFDDWSFCEQFKALNRVRSDPECRGALHSQDFTFSPREKLRFARLTKSPPKWERPKPEVVAKEMNLSFLYNYGYDFGSTNVHPMANDGQQDFLSITNTESPPGFPDQRAVINNSLLVGCMIVQEGLHQSSFRWHPVAYDFLGNLIAHIRDGRLDYIDTFGKITLIAHRMDLCEPVDGAVGGSAA
jgi:hypothetical protein